MIYHQMLPPLPHSEKFDKPQSNKMIWAFQVCNAFTKRHSDLAIIESCFYCKYADFLIQDILGKQTGNCCYPEIQIPY